MAYGGVAAVCLLWSLTEYGVIGWPCGNPNNPESDMLWVVNPAR